MSKQKQTVPEEKRFSLDNLHNLKDLHGELTLPLLCEHFEWYSRRYLITKLNEKKRILKTSKFWVIDETDGELGPFSTFEEAYQSMLTYLNMTNSEYQSSYMAQELVYISREENS
ncbi:TPA: hypothetical protein TY904_001819 [Streptococcus suis]|nr:hypothetical protein [Streptococcus suis]